MKVYIIFHDEIFTNIMGVYKNEKDAINDLEVIEEDKELREKNFRIEEHEVIE